MKLDSKMIILLNFTISTAGKKVETLGQIAFFILFLQTVYAVGIFGVLSSLVAYILSF